MTIPTVAEFDAAAERVRHTLAAVGVSLDEFAEHARRLGISAALEYVTEHTEPIQDCHGCTPAPIPDRRSR